MLFSKTSICTPFSYDKAMESCNGASINKKSCPLPQAKIRFTTPKLL